MKHTEVIRLLKKRNHFLRLKSRPIVFHYSHTLIATLHLNKNIKKLDLVIFIITRQEVISFHIFYSLSIVILDDESIVL